VQSLPEIMVQLRTDYCLMAHGNGHGDEPEQGGSRSRGKRPGIRIHPGTFAATMILASD
jgi:hypothetical protein